MQLITAIPELNLSNENEAFYFYKFVYKISF